MEISPVILEGQQARLEPLSAAHEESLIAGIEVTDVFEKRDSAALFGFAGGSFQSKETESWRLPAAWKAIARDGHVTLWQVFADTKIPFEIIERNG